MSDQALGSEDNCDGAACVSGRCYLEYCGCTESSYEFAQGSESNNDLISTDNPINSGTSWDYVDHDHDQPQQQHHQQQASYPENTTWSNDHGLTLQRLDELQADLSPTSQTDNVDSWAGPYNPLNSQLFEDSMNTMGGCDSYESSTSTVLLPIHQGRIDVALGHRSNTHRSFNPLSNFHRPVVSLRDFINSHCTRIIWLVGMSAAVQSLLQTVGDRIRRQATSDHQQLCALYALEISLRAMYSNNSAALALISFESLLEIFRSPEYRRLAFDQAERVRDPEVLRVLLSPGNLSTDAIGIILHILGRQMNEWFALGVCAPAARGAVDVEHTYNVYIRSSTSDGRYTRVVWIYNNNLTRDDFGCLLNHWSGFGDSILTGYDNPVPPFCLRVASVDTPGSNVIMNQSAVCTPPSTADSSYCLAESPQFSKPASSADRSRIPSIEPEFGNYPSNRLSPRKPSIRRKTLSQSSRNSNKEQAQCELCGKVVQINGLSKHKKTHEQGRGHPCLHCSRRFQYPKDVRRHQSTHNPSREWKCYILDCPYALNGFTREDHLLRHIATVHSNSGPPDTTPFDNFFDDSYSFE